MVKSYVPGSPKRTTQSRAPFVLSWLCAAVSLKMNFRVRQAVVLGAGLDTFAYRNPHKEARVFEVDHPATQEWKRERLQAESIMIPSNLTYVPVDFEHQTLATRLEESGFDANSPAFFSWLGVVPYLTRVAFLTTLTFIATLPAGSGVVFDFAVESKLLGIKERLFLAALSARVAAAGEPFRLFFYPDRLAAEMKTLGFRTVEILDAAQINARYFHNRADGLRIAGNTGRLLCAWV